MRETGLRANIGATWTRIDPTGWSIGVTGGRVLRARDADNFAADSPLGGRSSDWLLAANFDNGGGLAVANRALFDDSARISRNELRVGWLRPDLNLSAGYIWIDRDEDEGRVVNASELAANIGWQIKEGWWGEAETRYDFAADRAQRRPRAWPIATNASRWKAACRGASAAATCCARKPASTCRSALAGSAHKKTAPARWRAATACANLRAKDQMRADMRQFLSGIALAAMFATGAVTPAAAQTLFAPVVYVNDSAVTRYEVDQRMRFMQVIGAPDASATAAERALVDDRLRIQAARQIGVEITPEGLQAGLEEFAGRAGLDAAGFIAQLERAGIEEGVFRDFVEAGTVWRDVVRARLRLPPRQRHRRRGRPRAAARDRDADHRPRPAVGADHPRPSGTGGAGPAAGRTHRRLAPDRGPVRRSRAAVFGDLVEAGGRLEPLALDNLPPSLRLDHRRPAAWPRLTPPLPVEARWSCSSCATPRARCVPGAREQVLDYHDPAAGLGHRCGQPAARATSCDELYVQAGPEAAAQIQRQTVSQGAIPQMIGARLASLDANEAGVVPSGAGADVVMLCSRQPALAAQAQVATTALPDDGVEAAIPQPEVQGTAPSATGCSTPRSTPPPKGCWPICGPTRSSGGPDGAHPADLRRTRGHRPRTGAAGAGRGRGPSLDG